mmetsp:Transcript_24164/g.66971  ORF Transcript_24164/g.66971 Transcript_24164/m.66971 type:complete len:923 (+) Transcript_24164:140-2908(+)
MTTPAAPASASSGTQEERLLAMLSSCEETKSASEDSGGSGFSVASYLNLALESSLDNDQDLQQKMAQLALQLQLQTQSCHEDIGRIGAELQAILPRCHADVGRISLGLAGLQQDATTLLENTGQKTQTNVSSSLETLSTLHALQANLKRTHEILTAAATWDSTLAEIPPLLAPAQQQQGDDKSSATPDMASNLPQAVQKLALLEKGEKALRGMPNPEERTAALVKLRQQISNLLQPQLQHALQHMSSRLGPLQQCVSLYSQLDMLDNLLQEYVSTRPAPLHKAWFDFSASASASATTKEKESAFAGWIPTWLESVLQLLQDERRQASSVFGPAQVPVILALVLQETFRPILPSFQSRLAVSHGNLELICNLYKSTLQFLSLAYESVAGCWLDWVENTTGAANLTESSDSTSAASARPLGGVAMYKKMVSIYKQITSPFARYQTSFSQLEQTRAQLDYNTPFSSSVEAVVPSCQNIDLEDLTTATDSLLVVAQEDVAKAAEAALGRFEFLQGGYHAITALDIMDQELARRVQLLVSTLQKIVNAMDWAAVFDEPHVLAALQVLKIAATCKTQVAQLQEQMRQRFLLLRERMATVSAREKEALEGRSFLIPDALSPVEINALLCYEIFQKDDDSAPAVLTRLGGGGNGVGRTQGSGAGAVLLGQTQTAVSQLAATCHKFVFQACSSVPQKHLKDMAAMSSWKEPSSTAAADSYGTLPQSYITQVGEHMLALVQALEPFASDKKSLALANEVMSDVRQVAEQPWRDFISTCGQKDSHNVIIQKLMKADGEILDYVVGGDDAVIDEEDDDDDGVEDKEVAAFCNAWLDVVGLAVTGRLLERILSIPTLTEKGCEHLNADLSYLQNVLVALGVSGHPHPLLGHVSELVTLDSSMLSERIKTMDKTNQLQATLVGMEQRLAAMKSVGG